MFLQIAIPWIDGCIDLVKENMQNFYDQTLETLAAWCADVQEKPFRAKQVWEWVYQKQVIDWNLMSNLPLAFREKLALQFSMESLSQAGVETSKDGETMKFLWKLSDGKLVESVLILAPGRRTVCVSSQVGCPARCAFCASGKEGLIRDLTQAEIFEQVYHIERWLRTKDERVSHVVFMGMGEPLENYDAVTSAIRMLCDPNRLNLSERRITVSTVGVIEGIRKLAQEEFRVNLVLSLHAPNQHIRKKIIPYARKYDLSDILSSMLEYAQHTKRNLTYEYTLLAGINDEVEHAKELALLLKGHPCTVNLIPYNPVEGLRLQRPEKEQIEAFKHTLEQRGIVTTWRYTKGKDIAAACGQLALKKQQEGKLSLVSS